MLSLSPSVSYFDPLSGLGLFIWPVPFTWPWPMAWPYICIWPRPLYLALTASVAEPHLASVSARQRCISGRAHITLDGVLMQCTSVLVLAKPHCSVYAFCCCTPATSLCARGVCSRCMLAVYSRCVLWPGFVPLRFACSLRYCPSAPLLSTCLSAHT